MARTSTAFVRSTRARRAVVSDEYRYQQLPTDVHPVPADDTGHRAIDGWQFGDDGSCVRDDSQFPNLFRPEQTLRIQELP
eukprot:scaffold3856_cov169-Amphora_coffeaeformis.AAC.9